MYVKTNTILDKILAQKVEEVARQRQALPLMQLEAALKQASPPRDARAALKRDTVALIAEVKKASPSKGVLIENFDPVALGTTYAQNGAAAISVLTDAPFFQGHLDYMTAVRDAVDVPVLRKDFIIDPYQVIEARAGHADIVLLIVAALEDGQMAELYAAITELGMTALVEVHNEAEVERALKLNVSLMGINNRDLRTFDVDLGTTARVAQVVPGNVLLVAESGIGSPEDVLHMGQLGAHAVLVGESLVKVADRSGDLPGTVRAFSQQPREVKA